MVVEVLVEEEVLVVVGRLRVGQARQEQLVVQEEQEEQQEQRGELEGQLVRPVARVLLARGELVQAQRGWCQPASAWRRHLRIRSRNCWHPLYFQN